MFFCFQKIYRKKKKERKKNWNSKHCSKERRPGLLVLWNQDCSIYALLQDFLLLMNSHLWDLLWILQLVLLMHFACWFWILTRFCFFRSLISRSSSCPGNMLPCLNLWNLSCIQVDYVNLKSNYRLFFTSTENTGGLKLWNSDKINP